MNPPPLYILAKNRREAADWASEHDIPSKDWRLMTGGSARGMSSIRLARIGGWAHRRDILDIEWTLDAIQATGQVIEIEAP